MENKVNLYGASGHCKVIIDILQECKNPIGIVFDDLKDSNYLLDFKITSDKNGLKENSKWIIAIGNNKARKQIVENSNLEFTIAKHPKAIIAKNVTVGEGTVIMAAAIINISATIGKHCIVNSAAIIEHDCFLDSYAHVSPNAALAGSVTIGEGTHVGIGAIIIQGTKIGKWATIGAGAVIIADVPDFAVVVGNPGKIIKFNAKNE